MNHGNSMFHGNGDYSFWGMHMFGWFIMLILFIILLAWFTRFRRRKWSEPFKKFSFKI